MTEQEETVEIITKRHHLSIDATMFSTLMACGRLFDFRHNYNFLPNKGKSNSLETGSLFHKIKEVYTKHIIKGFPRTTAIEQSLAAGQLYIIGCPHCADFQVDPEHPDIMPQCKHQPNEYPGLKNTPEENERYRTGWRWVLQTAQDYYEFYKNDSWIPIAAEEVKGDVLYQDDELIILWKAKFDTIVDTGSGVYPMDIKTFKQRREKSTLNNQFIGQCLLMKTRQIIIDKVSFATTLKPEERFVREPISYSAARLVEWQSEIMPYWAYKYVQYHESGYWPPNFTHCDTMYGPCLFKGICESDPDMRQEELRINFMVGPRWDIQNVEDD